MAGLFGDDEESDRDAPEPEDGGGTDSASEGLPEPRRARQCLGHESVEADLLARIASGRFPHALIFSGISGIGKATMAFRLARFLLKKDDGQAGLFGAPEPPRTLDVLPDDPVFARVASGGHADLLYVERETDEKTGKTKGALDVEQVRKVAPFLRMTASDGGWRVVILDDADTMTRSAQNAILKILEEPPPRSLIVLIAHRAGALLPTIRSRAHLVPFQPLSGEIVRQLLETAHPDWPREDRELVAELSEGSVGGALKMAGSEEGGGGLPFVRKICALFDPATPAPWTEAHALAATLSGKDKAQDDVWRLLCALAPRLAQRAALSGARRGQAVKELLEIYDDLRHSLVRAEAANLDRATAALCAFGIVNAKRQAAAGHG